MTRRAIAAAVLVLIAVLTGCGNRIDTIDEIREQAEIRDVCESSGGVFREWQGELADYWRCDLSSIVQGADQ